MKQPRDRGRFSWSGGRSPWAGFHELNDHVFPHFQRCWEAVTDLVAAERMEASGEGASYRLTAAKEEHVVAHALHKSATKFYLSVTVNFGFNL